MVLSGGTFAEDIKILLMHFFVVCKERNVSLAFGFTAVKNDIAYSRDQGKFPVKTGLG